MADEIRCSVELRADDSMASPGRLTGVLMTYGQRAGDRAELFEADALTWPSNGVVLRRQHQRGAPILRFVPEVRGRDVVIDVPLPCTEAGRSAAVEVRDGLLPGLSVEFRATGQRYAAGVRRISGAILTGAGLVDDPSYPGARVEVRGRRRRLWL